MSDNVNGIPLSKPVLVPTASPDAEYMNGSLPWTSVQEYLSYKDNKLAVIPKRKTILVTQNDGKSREMWNPDDNRTFVIKTADAEELSKTKEELEGKLTEIDSKVGELFSITTGTDVEVPTEVIEGKYITNGGTLGTLGSYGYTKPILFHAGDTIIAKVSGTAEKSASIATCIAEDSTKFTPRVIADETSVWKEYTYTLLEDAYVSISGSKSNLKLLKVKAGLVDEVSDLDNKVSDLGNKVSELGNEVKSERTATPIEGYIRDGIAISASYYHTDYIDIVNKISGRVYAHTNTLPANTFIFCYDEGYNYLGGVSGSTASVTIASLDDYELPEGTRYVRFNVGSQDSSYKVIYSASAIDSIKTLEDRLRYTRDDIYRLSSEVSSNMNLSSKNKEDIEIINSRTFHTKEISWVIGKYIKGNGNIGSLAQGAYSDKIALHTGDTIRFSCYCNSGAVALVKDNGDTPYDVIIASDAPTSTAEKIDVDYMADEDCYVRLSTLMQSTALQAKPIIIRAKTLEERIESLEEADVLSRTDELESIVGVPKVTFNVIKGKYISSGGKLNTFANGHYSTPIHLFEGESVTFTGNGNSNVTMIATNDYIPLVVATGSTSMSIKQTVSYTADKDIDVVFSAIAAFSSDDVIKDAYPLCDRMNRIENICSSIDNSPFDIVHCPPIYARTINNATSNGELLNYNNTIYPEGFCYYGTQIMIDNGKGSPISSVSSEGSSVMVVKLTNQDGRKVTENITIKRTSPSNPKIKGKKVRLLCFGESTTAISIKPSFITGDAYGPWNPPSCVTFFSKIDNIYKEGCELITLGHVGNTGSECNYKGNMFTLRSFHEGLSGNPLYAQLNWPFSCKMSNSGEYDYGQPSRMWKLLGLYSKTPYNQAVYNTDIEEYSGTSEQIALITKTPFGFYKVDADEIIWRICQHNQSSSHPFADTTSAWSGSDSQIQMVNDWFEGWMDNPSYGWYNKDKARAGVCGFSLEKYLERYRTMDDEGVRLSGSAGQTVIGSDGKSYTIGTRVSNVEDYDVCMPTHITMSIGINDTEGVNTSANIVENVKTFAEQINVPFGFYIARYTGVCYPSLWSEDSVCHVYNGSIKVQEATEALLSWFENQENKYLIGIRHIQYPASHYYEKIIPSVVNPTKQVINCVPSNVHSGNLAYRSVGFQILEWIHYTLSIE